jgi:hypothetical protein
MLPDRPEYFKDIKPEIRVVRFKKKGKDIWDTSKNLQVLCD